MGRTLWRAGVALLLIAVPLLMIRTIGRDDENTAEGTREAPSERAVDVSPPGSAEAEMPLPAPGTATVAFANGRVTILSNGARRLEILEEISRQKGFMIIRGALEPRALTLRIEESELIAALQILLDGVPYDLVFDFDEQAGKSVLSELAVGALVSATPIADSDAMAAASDPVLEGEFSEEPAANETAEPRRWLRELQRRHGTAEERRIKVEDYKRWTEQSEPELIAMLDSSDPEVRSNAVDDLPLEGQGSVGEVRLERMTAILADDPDFNVRVVAADRLSESESPAALGALANALSDESEAVVLAAIAALEEIDDPVAIDYLKPLLSDPREDVRDGAEDAIDWLEP